MFRRVIITVAVLFSLCLVEAFAEMWTFLSSLPMKHVPLIVGFIQGIAKGCSQGRSVFIKIVGDTYAVITVFTGCMVIFNPMA